MKSILSLLLGATFLIIAFSCSNQSKEKNESTKKVAHRTLPLSDTISLQKFNTWKNNWASHGQQWSCNNELVYFDMPLIDLAQTLGEQPIKSRYYMGLDMTTQPYTPHLLLVGVNEQGQPMIDPRNGNHVYDVTTPCPPACSE